MDSKKNEYDLKIAVVIPYYNASRKIVNVVAKLPRFISHVVIVDDCGKEPIPWEEIKKATASGIDIHEVKNLHNMGVGGATKAGFVKALELEVDLIVKMDADDQMDSRFLPQMISVLENNEAEYVKGNRFRDLKALKKMPFVRRMGNLVLSFLIKMATGYWSVFDPTNGYFMIKSKMLKEIDLDKLSNRYFFETSLIAQLYYVDARIKDIAMPAIYADEQSSMKVWKMPFIFSVKLLKLFLKRIVKKYFLFDFSIGSVYLFFGTLLFSFGSIFGVIKWYHYDKINALAPTGTIMVVTISLILGFQLLLQFIQYDILNAPKVTSNG